jgi:hypothetical protein
MKFPLPRSISAPEAGFACLGVLLCLPEMFLPQHRADVFHLQFRNGLIRAIVLVQGVGGLEHWLWRDMDQSSEPPLQFEDYSNGARHS